MGWRETLKDMAEGVSDKVIEELPPPPERHAGMRERQAGLGQWWDKVTGRDNLKAQIENLQEHSEATASRINDLNYEITFDREVRKAAAELVAPILKDARAAQDVLNDLAETNVSVDLDRLIADAAGLVGNIERDLRREMNMTTEKAPRAATHIQEMGQDIER